MITIIVIQPPEITITSNGCLLSILFYEECLSATESEFEWQIETDPDVFVAADGDNDGLTYLGEHEQTYRLKVTCNGCIGYSDPITLNCPTPCTVVIDSIVYDDEEEELVVTYTGTPGSNPFSTGYLVINETNTPNLGNCAGSGGWMFVINVTLTAISDEVHIPYTPITLPTCIAGHVNINAGECTDSLWTAIS